MAREIDFSKPLSADDQQYVSERPWLKAEAEQAGFDVNLDDEFVVDSDEEEGTAPYSEWTVDDLKAELKARDLTVSGSKEQLVERLEEDDNSPEE